MKYSEVLKEYNLTDVQKIRLHPVRRTTRGGCGEYTLIRRDFLNALLKIDYSKKVGIALLALLSKLSSRKFTRVSIADLREEIHASNTMEVTKALDALLAEKILLSEDDEKQPHRYRYLMFNPDFSDIDIDSIDDDDD